MIPKFAVVGHPNKGKSSIVSTLAEDARVAIAPMPGTTVNCRSYPLRIDGEVIYELIRYARVSATARSTRVARTTMP